MASQTYYSFQALPGFFGLPTDTLNSTHFGLSSKNWSRFKLDIADLQKDVSSEYKVFFLARHGQGVHNVAESQYGTAWWDCKWSLLEGDGTLVWGPDPELTALGRQQATIAHDAWLRELHQNHAPAPDLYICSPFTRAADTARITWEGLSAGPQLFKEQFRETIGLHVSEFKITCDKRHPKSWLQERFPAFVFEQGFEEKDKLWTVDEQEHPLHQTYRLHKAMERVFAEHKEATYVAISAHSGAIAHILAAIRHEPFKLLPGEMVPCVVKATKTDKSIPFPVYEPRRAPQCPGGP